MLSPAAKLFLLFPIVTLCNCSTPLLPPLPFLSAFLEEHSLFGLELWVPLEAARFSQIVAYRKDMWMHSATFLNSLVSSSLAVPAEGLNCTSLCEVRILRVVPPSAADGDKDVKSVFDSGSRDFWLIGVDARGDEGVAKATDLVESLKMDIDDQVYFYLEDNVRDTSATGEDIALRLLEAYKVAPDEKPVVLEYGSWSSAKGLRVSQEEIWHRRRDMMGFTLKVSTLPSRPYIASVEFGLATVGAPKFSGMFADVFHSLQEIMNFTYEMGSPEDGEWGIDKEGNWTGMVGQLQRREIDIAATDFTVTQERSTVMTFAQPITRIYHSLFIRNPADQPNYVAYTEPLHFLTWAALGLLIVITPPFLYVAVNLGPYYEEHRSEFTMGKSYVFAASVLVSGRGWSVTPSRHIGRIAFASLLCGGTLIYYHWEAMLISYLSTRFIVLPFRSLDGLVSNSDFNIALNPGSSYADAFKFSTYPLWQKAWQTRIEPLIDTYPKGEELAKKIVREDKFAFYDNFFAVRTYDEYTSCQIIAVPEKYDFKPYAYGFQQDSPYLGPFNYYLKQLREKGATKKILDEWESNPQICPDYSGKPLGFNNCFTAFGILILGLLVGVLIICLEKSLMTGGSLLNKDLRFLESYGLDETLLEDEDRIMADPTFDERAKAIIEDKNRRIREMEKIIRGRIPASKKSVKRNAWLR